jgi:hypothetical protein
VTQGSLPNIDSSVPAMAQYSGASEVGLWDQRLEQLRSVLL